MTPIADDEDNTITSRGVYQTVEVAGILSRLDERVLNLTRNGNDRYREYTLKLDDVIKKMDDSAAIAGQTVRTLQEHILISKAFEERIAHRVDDLESRMAALEAQIKGAVQKVVFKDGWALALDVAKFPGAILAFYAIGKLLGWVH